MDIKEMMNSTKEIVGDMMKQAQGVQKKIKWKYSEITEENDLEKIFSLNPTSVQSIKIKEKTYIIYSVLEI